MGADGCSSDDSDEEGFSRIHRTKSWRSPALKRLFHVIRGSGHYPRLHPSTQQVVTESDRLPPCDVAILFLDEGWLNASIESARGQ
jgi:hypothetical protein